MSSRMNMLLLTTSLLAIGGTAFAQDGAVEEVVVTGSRITRPGYTAPTPVTSISTQDLQARAPGNLNEIQRDLPQLTINENTNTNRGFPGSSNPNLRNLGASRTLVLLDGVRLTPSTPQGALDISSIPTALISRIDVVTGGASAAYGSDAVAGVLSIFLDTKFEGFKATAQVGQSKYGDYQNYLGSIALGQSFAGGRGHALISGEYYENLGVPRTDSRPWGRDYYGIVANPAYTPGNTTGQTRLLLLPGVNLANVTPGGVIVGLSATSPLRGIQFGQNGQVLPFTYGNYFTTNSTFAQGGSGISLADDINLSAYQKRYGGMANVEYEINDSVTAFANGMWVSREGSLYAQPNYNSVGATAITIRRDNPYIPAAVQAILAANPTITSFQLGRENADGINPDSDSNPYSKTISTQKSARIVGGLKGELGNGWTWDASANWGNTDFTQSLKNDRIEANYVKGLDAVINPATGQPACRVNVDASTTNDDAACVPGNPFGIGTYTNAFSKYAYGTSRAFGSYERVGGGANLQGEIYSLPAGEVALATGVEIRKDHLVFDADPISKALGYRTNNQGYSEGEYTIWEGYAETDVPLIKDSPLAAELSLNGAARYTHYSTSGGVTTWKVGANYKPIEDLRFRGVISRDIRAPSLYELYAGATVSVVAINDPVTGANQIVQNRSGGNPNLDPERGTTYSAGFVYQPSWLPRFQVSLDYYRIGLKGAIESTSPQNTVNFCNSGQTAFCANVVRGPGGIPTAVNTLALNTGLVKVRGWDFDTVYSFDFLGGTTSLHGTVSYTPSRSTTSSNVTLDSAGVIGTPKWRGNATLGWRNDKWDLQAQFNHIGGGRRDVTYVLGVDINDNHIDGRNYVNLSGAYHLTDNVTLFSKVENLFDVAPGINPAATIGQQQVVAQFDAVGQRFTGGIRLEF